MTTTFIQPLPDSVTDRHQLLLQAPQTVSMRAGAVILEPGEAIGVHSTRGNEEAILVLEGSGQLDLPELGTTEPLRAPCIAHVPPATVHDVRNPVGPGPLRYVFVVAPAVAPVK